MASSGGGGIQDVGLVFLRLAGVALLTHGYGKIVAGQHGGMAGFTDVVGKLGFPVPFVFAWAAALSELIGGALVAVGLFTRVAAIFAAVTMFVAEFLQHANRPFEERELGLCYLVIFLALACVGPGKWSVDGLARKKA